MGRVAASIGAVVLITVLYFEALHVNPTTVALSYLIAILVIATGWGIVEATAGSIAAVLCFNFFFLPPIGTFTIADPQNWVAFIAFLATAIIASQLSPARTAISSAVCCACGACSCIARLPLPHVAPAITHTAATILKARRI